MDEFVEKFQEFRRWLYEAVECSEFNSEEEKALNKVIAKFEDLDLNTAF